MNSIRVLYSIIIIFISLLILQTPNITAEIIPSTYSLNFDEGGHATPIGTTEYLSVTISSITTGDYIGEPEISYSAPQGFSIFDISPPYQP